MANCSLTYPQGILEDMLMKVDKFNFPIDFVVLEMEEDKEVLIIIGRPFLATGQALIDVKIGELTLRVGDEEVKFYLTKTVKFSDNDKITCMRVDSLIPSIGEVLHDMAKWDPLEKCLTKSLYMVDLEFEHPYTVQEMSETILDIEENEDTVVIEEEKKTPDVTPQNPGVLHEQNLEDLSLIISTYQVNSHPTS